MSIYIETPRLVLRTPVMDDAEKIVREMNLVWRNLQMWMSWSYDGANSVESVRENFIARAEDNHFLIGVCNKTDRFVVSTGMNPRENSESHETGYWVAHDFLGKGYATEATNGAVRYGFGALNVPSVYISHYESNEASRRVIEKLGFTKTGIREKSHARCLDGTLLDVHEYIMTDPSVLPDMDVRW